MATGREVVVGVAKGATWGTAVLAAALDGVLITADGMGVGAPEDLVAEEAGIAFQQTSEAGMVDIEGTLDMFLRYESALNRLIALAMGTAGVPATVDVSARLHTFQLNDSLDGIFGTLAIDKGPEVFEFASAKLLGFTITGEAGQPVTITFNKRADSLARNTSSGTNNNTTMGSVTYRSKVFRTLMQHLTFRVNSQSAGALASPADDLKISRFTLQLDRPHSTDHVSGQTGIIEPTEDGGLPVVTFGFDVPEYLGAVQLDRITGHTALKADLTFDSGVLIGSATQNADVVINIPQLILTAGEAPVNSANKITHAMNGRCEQAQTAPTGMTVTKPFEYLVHNILATDELA